MTKDLSTSQKDYAVFLPSISTFYSTFIGKQRFPDPVKGHYVDPDRIPKGIQTAWKVVTA